MIAQGSGCATTYLDTPSSTGLTTCRWSTIINHAASIFAFEDSSAKQRRSLSSQGVSASRASSIVFDMWPKILILLTYIFKFASLPSSAAQRRN
jgi:hypothetical protein